MTKTIHSAGHDALCAELIRIRLERGLTQAQLADRLHCHQSMVARIESGQRRIDVVELVVVARALEVDPSKIMKLVDSKTHPVQRI